MFHVDRIGQGNGLKDGSELVEPIRTLVEHPQIEVDFGQRTKPDEFGHLIVDERVNFVTLEFLAAVQEIEFQDEPQAHHFAV